MTPTRLEVRMGKRKNFTAQQVASFMCETGKQQSIHWDGKTPGLGLRVTAAGAKSYIFETRLHGKTLRLTIGDLRTWTIGRAQAEATRLKTLTDQGIDPRQQAAEQRARVETARNEAIRRDVTVAEAWDTYIKARRHNWSARHLADHNAIASAGGNKRKRADCLTEPGALAALMPLKLTDIDADSVKVWLRAEVTKRPTQAALAYRLLRAFLNWCNETPEKDKPDYRGIAAADACQARIARDILLKKSAKADCLQREQLPAWFSGVRQLGNPVISAYLQGLLLTGARREELAGLTWADVDFQWRSLTIRDKVEEERVIPLTPYVASLLSTLPRRNQWVFSSPTAASGRLMEPRLAHQRVLTAGGLPALTLHGLRRSFGTLSEWCEVPTGVVAQIMGHKPSATAEKHYRVRPLDLLRSWHVKIEAWILEQAGVEYVQGREELRLVS
jgi:integrase